MRLTANKLIQKQKSTNVYEMPPMSSPAQILHNIWKHVTGFAHYFSFLLLPTRPVVSKNWFSTKYR